MSQNAARSNPELESLEGKQKEARKRWKMLAKVLKEGNCSGIDEDEISVRRFKQFGLLTTTYLESIRGESGCWYIYRCPGLPDYNVKIKHLSDTLTASQLNGFNNTGNVCVWPCEEVMTYSCLLEAKRFRNKKICELGGGMTCLAAVSIAKISTPSLVELTDGNEISVHNLESIIEKNCFDKTDVHSRLLRWGNGNSLDSELKSTFDFVLCADCLFFDAGRQDLAQLIHDLLNYNGEAILFAPSRKDTFDEFVKIAKKLFDVCEEIKYNSKIWNLHLQLMSKDEKYDESLHYPRKLILKKLAAQS